MGVRRGLAGSVLAAMFSVLLVPVGGTAGAATEVSSVEDLIDAIEAANSDPAADVIELADDITITSVHNTERGANGLPVIDTEIVILGHGHVIERDPAAPLFRLFLVDGFLGDGALVLDDVTLRGGDVTEVTPVAACALNICVDNSGAAVLNLRGRVELRNGTTFVDNAAFAGGAVANTVGSTTATDVTFGTPNQPNTAEVGGAVHNFGNIGDGFSAHRSTFEGNEATLAGGAIHNQGSLLLADSVLVDNAVTGPPAAVSGGGALNNNTILGHARIVNSHFEANTADRGGAIVNFNASDIELINSDVVHNTATSINGGGGIHNDNNADLTVRRGRIAGNESTQALAGGGGIFNGVNGTLVLDGTSVEDNTAGADGGGVFIGPSATSVTIVDTRISGNVTTVFGTGGGISKDGIGPVDIIASVIADNTAAGAGGGIFFSNPTSNAAAHSITYSTISGNVSLDNGGGVASEAFTTTISIDRSTISGNAVATNGAVGEGGAGILNEHGIIEVANSTISGNQVDDGAGTLTGAGAGINNGNGGVVRLANTTVTDNRSRRTGGLRSLLGAIEVSDSIVAGNVATLLDAFGGPNCPSTGITDLGGNITDDGTNCPPGFTVSGSLLLGPLADNGGPTRTQALGAGSDAIDAGVTCADPGDQRGVARDVTCDSGAYEGDVVVPTVSFDVAASTVAEDPGGAATVDVTMTNPADGIAAGEVDVYLTVGGTAAGLGIDYSITSARPISFTGATFPAPGTSVTQSVGLDVVFDEVLEDDETIVLGLSDSGITGPADLGSIAHHVVTITDACEATPPSLSVSADPDSLWPPNHRLVPIEVTVDAADDSDPDPAVTLLSVTSNEPDDGLGDGDTPDDIRIDDDFDLRLRAERSGTGSGRIYTITYEATDFCGNTVVASTTVVVPFDRR